ncbi:unnamed protein product [Vitrella brassicaformis CCMP3155]|uniref:Dynamin N-terminal domain-containing protein n=4 Tax=Vitrella brassicaformis TaxID=1169539 RepID=A0A0G4ENU8_VITBC|nr:unnamed protein product [Vitrella brassicaformis CCMP3155]|eukprot:CEL99293.1 unnamed protein product [Vitrella brassicaformis CCMP3155]
MEAPVETAALGRFSSHAFRVEGLEDVQSNKLETAKSIVGQMQSLQDANVLYQKCFQLLRLGGLEAEMPRLVVFGQQSMGKTTLLDYIMGGPIGYSSTTTGTTHPVIIMLKPSETSNITARFQGKDIELGDLHGVMKEEMSKTATISREELELEMAIPGGVHAVFVDLPGIKDDSKEGADLTRSVVRGYVRNNPNDLYVLVKKANDDPANWPWQLRDFIMMDPPRGLGLKGKQTIVVGTRAKEFLRNEKNDVKTQAELLDHVNKRAVTDPNGNALPLFLLELFSLTIEEKENLNFDQRKNRMQQQIMQGRLDVAELLEHSFEPSDPTTGAELFRHFDIDLFKQELNTKFQRLLNEQLGHLERRLLKKKIDLQKKITEAEDYLTESAPQSCREYIKLFLRELMQIVTELVTGNYTIFRLPESGDRFLQRWGGNLEDNLKEGHELALEIFPDNLQYDPAFLDKVMPVPNSPTGHNPRIRGKPTGRTSRRGSVPERGLAAPQGENGAGRSLPTIFQAQRGVMSNPPSPGHAGQSVQWRDDAAVPYPSQPATSRTPPPHMPALQVGQPVRVSIKGGFLLGTVVELPAPDAPLQVVQVTFVQRVVAPSPAAQNGALSPTETSQQDAPERHSHQTTETREIRQKPVEMNRIYPVSKLIQGYQLGQHQIQPYAGLYCWQVYFRPDGWEALQGVAVRSVHHPQAAGANAPNPFDTGIAVVLPIYRSPLPTGLQGGDGSYTVGLDDLWVDIPPPAQQQQQIDGMTVPHQIHPQPQWTVQEAIERNAAEAPPALHLIAGEFAQTKLLNQLSLTHLGRWLKFHLGTLEPDRHFSDHVLLQMMRSVRHVVDKADWEPLVADLLQANVRGGMLHLARLSACATAVALRRILRASVHEVVRLVEVGELAGSLAFLIKSNKFIEELQQAMEDYIKDKAFHCAETMRDLIFEQTHAIHFEMIEDFFEGCQHFERDFLGTVPPTPPPPPPPPPQHFYTQPPPPAAPQQPPQPPPAAGAPPPAAPAAAGAATSPTNPNPQAPMPVDEALPPPAPPAPAAGANAWGGFGFGAPAAPPPMAAPPPPNVHQMDEVVNRVKTALALRKQKLGITDIYTRHGKTSSLASDLIYDEVRIQFWACKMLLQAPLTTKLYMQFVKDIKDKSQHLAAEGRRSLSCESELEKCLQDILLCEKSGTGRPLPRTDEELLSYYGLSLDRSEAINRLHRARRSEEFVRNAIEGVGKLRHAIHRQGGVDFLMKLDIRTAVQPPHPHQPRKGGPLPPHTQPQPQPQPQPRPPAQQQQQTTTPDFLNADFFASTTTTAAPPAPQANPSREANAPPQPKVRPPQPSGQPWQSGAAGGTPMSGAGGMQMANHVGPNPPPAAAPPPAAVPVAAVAGAAGGSNPFPLEQRQPGVMPPHGHGTPSTAAN